jgi:hypothetical protein
MSAPPTLVRTALPVLMLPINSHALAAQAFLVLSVKPISMNALLILARTALPVVMLPTVSLALVRLVIPVLFV